jgi:hypothetical protein
MSNVIRLNEIEPSPEFELACQLMQDRAIADAAIDHAGYRLTPKEIINKPQTLIFYAGEVALDEERARVRIELPDYNIILSEAVGRGGWYD